MNRGPAHSFVNCVLILLLLLCQCAYYNTFYNAKQSYRRSLAIRKKSDESAPPASNELALLDEVIQKCAKVISRYPKSKWVDDALLLMGKSYMRKGDYGEAARKFQELTTYYPDSKWRSEALYLHGTIRFEQKQYFEARESFNRIIQEPQSQEWKRAALFRLGQTFSAEGINYEARDIFQDLIQRYPGSSLALDGEYEIGKTWFKEGDYAKAIETYENILSKNPGKGMVFDLMFEIGRCHHLSGDDTAALDILEQLVRREEYFDKNPQVLFEMGRIHEENGKYEEAVAIYDRISNQYPSTSVSAGALYAKGVIFRDNHEDYTGARNAFEQIRRETPKDSLAVTAADEIEDLIELDRLEMKITTGDDDEVLSARFQLAELYLLDMRNHEAALQQYREIIESDPRNEFSLQARLAMAWIYRNRFDTQKAKADSLYREIVRINPLSRFAGIAQYELTREENLSPGQ
jgi:TolA-binding protein